MEESATHARDYRSAFGLSDLAQLSVEIVNYCRPTDSELVDGSVANSCRVSQLQQLAVVTDVVSWCFKPSQPQRIVIIRAEGGFRKQIYS